MRAKELGVTAARRETLGRRTGVATPILLGRGASAACTHARRGSAGGGAALHTARARERATRACKAHMQRRTCKGAHAQALGGGLYCAAARALADEAVMVQGPCVRGHYREAVG